MSQRSPRWRYTSDTSYSTLPISFFIETASRAFETEEKLPSDLPGGDDLANIFHSLHQLDMMDRRPWSSTVDPRHFVNAMFEATYHVLTLLAQLRRRRSEAGPAPP